MMQRFALAIISMLTYLMMSSPSIEAQGTTPQFSSLTVSEMTINEALRELNTNPDNNLAIDLQPGQIVVNLVATGQNGNVNTFGLTLVPFVNEVSQLDLEATLFTINELEFPLNTNNNPAVSETTENISTYLTDQTAGGQIQSVTVTDHLITVEWSNIDPLAPIILIRDNLFTLIYTEDTINSMPRVTNPTGANVSAIDVDLQEGQAVINIMRTVEPELVSYVIMPTVINNRVLWQIDANADFEGSVTGSIFTVWSAYFQGIYREDGLIFAGVTDDAITFTWDLDTLSAPETGDAVVTYTVTETEINEVLASYTNESVANIAVDMQPGQISITAVGFNENDELYAITLVMIPSLENGQVTWELDSVTLNDIEINVANLNSSQNAINSVTQGFGGRNPNANITAFEITDDAMMMTVRYR